MKRLKKTPIVIATTNPGKLAQFADLFAKLTDRYDIVSLKDVKYKKAIIENGKTFKQNSLIKARTVSKALKCIAIADDSGLCINSLHGWPGVYSARVTGDHEAKRIDVIKCVLEKIKKKSHKAIFVCVMSCVFPNGKVITTKGVLKGKISDRFFNLYGGLTYDPIFIPKGFTQTMSMLTDKEKNAISHRGIAARKLIFKFNKYIGKLQDNK